jgi:RimJ/RimL family protein N-acetyltransferase
MTSNPMERRLETKIGTVIIRPGREEDAADYRELRLEALRSHPEAFSADYRTSEAHPPVFWQERLRSTGVEKEMVFAEHDDVLVGMCGIFRGESAKTRHSATLVSVYVCPVWRGQGIAEGMIGACLDWARAHDVTVVKLGVASDNAPAIRCYSRCGFREYGVEPQAIQVDGVMHEELLMFRTDL